MRGIIFFLCLLISSFAFSQSNLYLRADSTHILKIGGNNELILQNATRNVPGILINKGNGRTEFSRARISGDTLFIGRDTVIGVGGTPLRFGVSGEDATASQVRQFNAGAYFFNIKGSGDSSTQLGPSAFATGDSSLAMGKTARTVASNQISIGNSAGLQATVNGIYIGQNAGKTNTGTSGTFIGSNAGITNSGNSLTAVGNGAGRQNTATSVSAFGVNAGRLNTGARAAFLGTDAGNTNTGTDVIGIGSAAARTNNGHEVVFIGTSAGDANEGDSVVMIGYGAGHNNTGNVSVAIGRYAADNNTGTRVTGVGDSVLTGNTFNSVIALGYHSRPTANNEFNISDSIKTIKSSGLTTVHGSDTTNKPLVQDPSTGIIQRATYWPGGGGGSGTINSGNDGEAAFYDGTGTTISGKSTFVYRPWGRIDVSNYFMSPNSFRWYFRNDADSATSFMDYNSPGNQFTIEMTKNGGFFRVNTGTPTGGFAFVGNGQYLITGNNAGQIGIGTIGPNYNLDVNGTSGFAQQTTHEAQIRMKEISAPSTPAANYVVIYPKSDGKVYAKDDAGLESLLTNAAAGIDDVLAVGQTLTTNRTIDASTFELSVSGSATSPNNTFEVTNSSSGTALQVTGTSGTGVNITNSSGTGIIASSTTGLAGLFVVNPSSTNTAVAPITIRRQTSGTPAAGIAASLPFEVEGTGSTIAANTITSTLTAVGAGAQHSRLTIDGYNAGTPGTVFTLDGNGALILTGRFQPDKGADVASANDLTLGSDGNVFVITGTTQINAITTANWNGAPEITLIFTGVTTVKHNTAGGGGTARIFLAGSVDMTTANHTTLTLVWDGTQWQEKSRKIP